MPLVSKVNCSVLGCFSTYRSRTESGERVRFFGYPARPHEVERRKEWIRRVRLARREDSSTWLPSRNSKVCSKHFIGNKKGEHPKAPNYNPSIFPRLSKEAVARYRRAGCYQGDKRTETELFPQPEKAVKASLEVNGSAPEDALSVCNARSTMEKQGTQPCNMPNENGCIPPRTFRKLPLTADDHSATLDDFLREWATDPYPKYVNPRLVASAKDDVVCSKKEAGYECPVCKDRYGSARSLRRHLSRRSFLARLPCRKCRATHLAFNRCTLIMRAQGCRVEASGATLTTLPSKETMVPVELSEDTSTGVTQEDVPMTVLEKVLQNVVCSECHEELGDASAREDHFQPSRGNLIRCTSCPMLCTSECALRAHRRLHTQRRPFVCPECGMRCQDNWAVFHEHVNRHCHHFDRIVGYHCQLCPALLLDQNELACHIVDTHGNALHKCQACPMAFISLESFHMHRKTAHPKLRSQCWLILKCPLCEAVFASSELLTNHVVSHLEQCGRSLFKCTSCDSLQPTRTDLVSHLEKMHPQMHNFAAAFDGGGDRLSDDKPAIRAKSLTKETEIIEVIDDENEDMDREEVLDEKALDAAAAAAQQPMEASPKSDYSRITKKPEGTAGKKGAGNAVETREEPPGGSDGGGRSCAKCAFRSEDAVTFRNHIATHRPPNQEVFQCPECGLCYIVELSLRKHLRGVHRIEEAADGTAYLESPSTSMGHRCSVCLALFDTERELKSHTRSHGMAFLKKVKAKDSSALTV